MVDVLDLKHPDPFLEQEAELIVPATTSPDNISWTVTHEVTPRQRMREYVFLAAIALIGGGVAIWQSSWLTLAVVVLGIAAWELHNHLPSSHRIEVDYKGITIDGHHHSHDSLHSFDLHKMPDGTTQLSLKTTRWHLPRLQLPLGDQDPEEVYAVLARHLLQDEHRMSLVDYFLKK